MYYNSLIILPLFSFKKPFFAFYIAFEMEPPQSISRARITIERSCISRWYI